MAIKAIRATILIGNIELDVFQLPNGSYGFSSSGIAKILGLSSDKRVREILSSKALEAKTRAVLGFGKNDPFKLKLDKVSTFDSGNISFLSLELLMLIVAYESFKNDNLFAQAILEASLAESLERRADEAFGVIRTEEERNQRLDLRLKGKLSRRELTDSIKEYIQNHSELNENYAKFIYVNCSDHLNKIILGASSKQAKEFYELPKNSLLRNAIPSQALRELELTENYAGRLIDELDVEPLEAVKQACSTMFTRKIGLIEKPD